jgi:COX assembly mitochondrial protein 1
MTKSNYGSSTPTYSSILPACGLPLGFNCADMDMAPNTLSSGAMQDPSSASHQPNLRNPLPLSAAQEAQVKDLYYRRVRGHCAQEIKGMSSSYSLVHDGMTLKTIYLNACLLTMLSDFADCALGRTISATWVCRDQRLGMNSCMISHATRAEEDAARAEWFSGRDERKRKREVEVAAVERRREEVIDLIKKAEEKEKTQETTGLGAKNTAENNKAWWH